MTPLVEMVMGWVRSQIVEPPDQLDETDQRRTDAALVYRLIHGEDGPALMELLAKITVLRPSLDPTLHGSASHDFAQRRTGENGVFAALVHLHDTHVKLQGTHHGNPRSERPAAVFGWWDDAPGLATGNADANGDAGGYDPSGAVAFRG